MRKRGWLGACVLLVIAGCASKSDMRVTHYSDDRYDPTPDSQTIEVLSKKPDRAFIEVADLKGWDGQDGADGKRLLTRMRKKARALGGNAIMKFSILTNEEVDAMHTGSVSTWTKKGQVNASGTVIRWKK